MRTQIHPDEADGKTVRRFFASKDWEANGYQVVTFDDGTYVALNNGLPSEPFHPFKIGKTWSLYCGLCTHAEYQEMERKMGDEATARLKDRRREEWVELSSCAESSAPIPRRRHDGDRDEASRDRPRRLPSLDACLDRSRRPPHRWARHLVDRG